MNHESWSNHVPIHWVHSTRDRFAACLCSSLDLIPLRVELLTNLRHISTYSHYDCTKNYSTWLNYFHTFPSGNAETLWAAGVPGLVEPQQYIIGLHTHTHIYIYGGWSKFLYLQTAILREYKTVAGSHVGTLMPWQLKPLHGPLDRLPYIYLFICIYYYYITSGQGKK